MPRFCTLVFGWLSHYGHHLASLTAQLRQLSHTDSFCYRGRISDFDALRYVIDPFNLSVIQGSLVSLNVHTSFDIDDHYGIYPILLLLPKS